MIEKSVVVDLGITEGAMIGALGWAEIYEPTDDFIEWCAKHSCEIERVDGVDRISMKNGKNITIYEKINLVGDEDNIVLAKITFGF